VITKLQYEVMRDVFLHTRSITQAARESGVSRQTVALYTYGRPRRFPRIFDLVRKADDNDAEHLAAAQSALTKTLANAAEKTVLTPRGKRTKSGKVLVSTSEFRRMQSALRAAVEVSDRLTGNNAPQNGGVSINIANTFEARQAARVREWFDLEKAYLSDTEMKLPPMQRANRLTETVLRKLAASQDVRRTCAIANVLETTASRR